MLTVAWLALPLYVLGLALALGWRTLAQWRRTGDTGLRLVGELTIALATELIPVWRRYLRMSLQSA